MHIFEFGNLDHLLRAMLHLDVLVPPGLLSEVDTDENFAMEALQKCCIGVACLVRPHYLIDFIPCFY